MKYLLLTLFILFGAIGGITLVLSFILTGLYLVLFSLFYLGVASLFLFFFIKHQGSSQRPFETRDQVSVHRKPQ